MLHIFLVISRKRMIGHVDEIGAEKIVHSYTDSAIMKVSPMHTNQQQEVARNKAGVQAVRQRLHHTEAWMDIQILLVMEHNFCDPS